MKLYWQCVFGASQACVLWLDAQRESERERERERGEVEEREN